MGFAFEPTPQTQGWTVEVRGVESFYLHDPHPYPMFEKVTDPRSLVFASEDRTAWCFDMAYLPAVLAALRMVEDYLERKGMTHLIWRPELYRRGTVVRREGDVVRVEGDYPEIAFPDRYREGEPDMGGVELNYAELPHLQRELRLLLIESEDQTP